MSLTPEQKKLFDSLSSSADKQSEEYLQLKEEFKKGLGKDGGGYLTMLAEAEREAAIIHIVISERDRITAQIRNGNDGLVTRIAISERKIGKDIQEIEESEELLRFRGTIGPVMRIDNETPGLKWIINKENNVGNIDEAILYFKQKFALRGKILSHFIEVINSYVMECIDGGKFTNYINSPISVGDGKINVDFKDEIDLKSILTGLRNFFDFASHKNAFLTTMSWSLLAPLHFELKKRSYKGLNAPIIVESGKTQGGKTTLGMLFIGKGYNLNKDQYFYPYNRVHTRYMMMKHMSETNLPALIDDIPIDWIPEHKEDLKAYVQTGHFGDRGTASQGVIEYSGKRSFMLTINDDVSEDEDLAFSNRAIFLRYTAQEQQRKKKGKFDELMDSLPPGFMYGLFRQIFREYDINTLLKEIESLESSKEWIAWAIGRINQECVAMSIEPFPQYEEDGKHSMSNAMEIAQEFIAEWQRIEESKEQSYDSRLQETTVKQRYRSKIEGSFRIDFKSDRTYIYFTPGAFKTLCGTQQLRVPYSKASNFMNNIKSNDEEVRVEFEGDVRSVRTGKLPLGCYGISIPVIKETIG